MAVIKQKMENEKCLMPLKMPLHGWKFLSPT
jgi:hypothetical protein